MKVFYKHFSALILVSTAVATSHQTPASEVQDKQAMLVDELVYLDQNWNESEREWFYFIDQGSRLMPYRIFRHLEQENNTELFSDSFNLLQYGFLPAKKSKNNPDGFPVGLNVADGHIGLTCAACHTQQLKYNNRFIRIDGGQSMLEMQEFLIAIESSMQATLNDPEKYERYVKRALGDAPTEKQLQELEAEFRQQYAERKEHNQRNHTDVPYGFSRLDAFGKIFNKGLLLTGVKDNYNTPDASTSYPYIWDTPQHDYVEWNGSQSNSDVGALSRNVAEVIGVFGHIKPITKKRLIFFDGGYESSVQTKKLREIEQKVATLYSPLWPDIFPAIDQSKAKKGRALYEKHCLSCHQDIDRDDPNRKIFIRMSTLDEVKTDPRMARNAITLRGKTGVFEGKPRFYDSGVIIGPEEPALFTINNLRGGVLKRNPLQAFLAKRDADKLGHSDEIHPPKYVNGKLIERGKELSDEALLAYRARPLNGIWATAPYLHNGSVPNLYELLLPAAKRKKSFYIGAWEYDPIKVGYVDTQRPGSFFLDTTLLGNSNAGHEYGKGEYGKTPFNEDEIQALIEYIKTL